MEPSAALRFIPLVHRTGVRVCGEIDLLTRAEWTMLLHSLATGAEDVHLELADLSFIDVGGVTVLARAALRLPTGRRLVLHHPPAVLVSLLDLLWGPIPTIEVREE